MISVALDMQADKGAPLVVTGKTVQIAKTHLTLDSVLSVPVVT